MRIKKDFLLYFLSIIAVLCFVLLSPAFAEFKKVNECELARTNASLTGMPALIKCPYPLDLLDEAPDCNAAYAFERCTSLLAEVEPAVNEDINSSLHDDYGYDWLKNPTAVGDLYFAESPVLSPVTVESGRCGFCGTDSVYVRIGLGSQEVELDSRDINVTLGSKAASIAGRDQTLGTIYLEGLKVKTNGNSYATLCMVEGKTAIYSQVDVMIDRIDLATISWGNADGCADEHDYVNNTGKAGYVGLKNTSITGVTASGSVSIDVAKDDARGLRMVNIGIANMSVGVESLDTTVVLGDKKDFSNTKYVLGTIYMRDLAMDVGGNLNIYNPADNDEATSLRFGLNVSSLTLDTLSWGDTDGVGSTTAAGFVGLRNLAINNLAIAGVATIETLTVTSGDTSFPVGTTAFVRIGLSKLNVGIGTLSTDVAFGSSKNNLDQVLGSVYLEGLNMYINGRVDIHKPSASQGIVFETNITIDNLHINVLSWGDADGIGGTTSAGYRGLRNLQLTGLKVAGQVGLEVATIDNTVTPASTEELMFARYGKTYNISPSFVHLGIGTGNADDKPTDNGTFVIGITSLTWEVVVDSSKSLDSTNASIIRTFYMSDLSAKVNGWVHIGAH